MVLRYGAILYFVMNKKGGELWVDFQKRLEPTFKFLILSKQV